MIGPMALSDRRYVNAFWDRGSNVVNAFWRDGGALKRELIEAEHTCFLRNDDLDRTITSAGHEQTLERWLRGARAITGLVREEKFARVRWRRREQLQDATALKLRDGSQGWFRSLGIEAFEADVSPVRRWLTDRRIEIARPRRVYLDIEADSRVPFAVKENARMLSWSLWDDDKKGIVARGMLQHDTDTDERRLLEELWHALDPYDQVVSWNGDRYDFPMVRARTAQRRLNVEPRRWLWLDHMILFRRMNMSASESGEEKQSLALGAVANALLGQGKLEDEELGKVDGSHAWELWCENRELLVRYNDRDVELESGIEEKTGYIELLQTVCESCFCFPDTAGINPTQQVEGFLLRLGAGIGHRFATHHYHDEVEQFRGAFVQAPTGEGIQQDVHVCDFAGLYPSIILTWNMSPETWRADLSASEYAKDHPDKDPAARKPPPGHSIAAITGEVFANEPRGLLCIALEEMRRLRKVWNDKKATCTPGTTEWKDADRRSAAYKICANSFYGVIGSPYSRFFVRAVAESCAQQGVWLIQETARAAQARGLDVIYIDTDGAFVTGCVRQAFKDFVIDCNKTLYPRLLEQRGCARNLIELDYEKAFSRLVMVSKKRYCNPPETPMLMPDFGQKPLSEVVVGDEVMGWKQGTSARKRHLVPSKVLAVHRHVAPIVKVTMSSGKVMRCTPDHNWLRARKLEFKRGTKHYVYPWTVPKVGIPLVNVWSEPDLKLDPERQRAADWLGGIFDGEGSLAGYGRGQIQISQSRTANPLVCARIEESLRLLGFRWTERANGACSSFNILGGKHERLRFARLCRPAKMQAIIDGLRGAHFGTPDWVTKIEPDGEGEVIGLTTSTGNYVAWGTASKNCGMYSHYKGKEATAETKPEIKGLEFKRGDAARIARRMQEQVAFRLVGYKCEPVTEPEGFLPLLEETREYVRTGALDVKEALLSQRMAKEIEEYVLKPKARPTKLRNAVGWHVRFRHVRGRPKLTLGETVEHFGRVVSGLLLSVEREEIVVRTSRGEETFRLVELEEWEFFGARPHHVEVAEMMRERGLDAGRGVRIEFVVLDADTSPWRLIPASDYIGTLDRVHLWEVKVFPPTYRLLMAAFPKTTIFDRLLTLEDRKTPTRKQLELF